MVTHHILHQYRVRYRCLEYRGISVHIPRNSGNRRTHRTRHEKRIKKDTPNTQCTTVRKEQGTQERNTRNTRNSFPIPSSIFLPCGYTLCIGYILCSFVHGKSVGDLLEYLQIFLGIPDTVTVCTRYWCNDLTPDSK